MKLNPCHKCGTYNPRIIRYEGCYLFKCKKCGRFSSVRKYAREAKENWNIQNPKRNVGVTK